MGWEGGLTGGERERNEGLLDCVHMRSCVVCTHVCVCMQGEGGVRDRVSCVVRY